MHAALNSIWESSHSEWKDSIADAVCYQAVTCQAPQAPSGSNLCSI